MENQPNGTTMMKTFLKALTVIVAMASLATAQEKATKPDSAATAGEKAQAKFQGNRAGEEREFEIADGVKMTFCWCPAGEFMMGSPKSEKGRDSSREEQVKVTLTKGFWIAKTEVTQSQWKAVMGSSPMDGVGPYGKPHPESRKGPNLPIVGVSWEDAQKFMEKVNAKIGNADAATMALPTEAQYEYAARAGETGLYPSGKLDDVAWYEGNSGGYTKPVGTKKANAWGLHDMNGNAWEWVQDCYDTDNPKLTGGTDPIAPEAGLNRVIRGGCWMKDADNCRLATRSYRAQMAFQCFSIGLRIVYNDGPLPVPAAANSDPVNNEASDAEVIY
jgi:formylglycine-generating enzyme required for sulfatase activity